MEASARRQFRTRAKLLLLAAVLVIALWFLKQVLGVLLLFFFALVLASALNAPTTSLEDRGLSRGVAAGVVILALLAVAAGLVWLVVPRIISEGSSLVESIPGLVQSISAQISRLLEDYPDVRDRVLLTPERAAEITPSLTEILSRAWGYSLTVIAGVVLAFLFFSVVLYMLILPRPLIATYLDLFPEGSRDRAARAFASGVGMVAGWIKANLIVGLIEAVLAFLFLSFLGVPGALVWAAFTLFAEFVPKLGPYVMAFPPTLVAFAQGPLDALWTALFYIGLNESMGNFVTPRVQQSTMTLHPVFSLFMTLTMASAFGLVGALAATPMAGFVKAFYEEFYVPRVRRDERRDERVEAVLHASPERLPRPRAAPSAHTGN